MEIIANDHSERHAFDLASISELEALLQTSRAQQEKLADELDTFVLNHIDDLQELFTATDEDSLQIQSDLLPLKGRYEVLNTFAEYGETASSLREQLSDIKAQQAESSREVEVNKMLETTSNLLPKQDFLSAYTLLEEIKTALDADDKSHALSAGKVTLLFDRASDQQAELLREVSNVWKQSFQVNQGLYISVGNDDALKSAIDVLEKVGSLKGKASRIAESIFEAILQPLLAKNICVTLVDQELNCGSTGSSGLQGIKDTIEFMTSRMPEKVLCHIRSHLMLLLIHSMRDDYIPSMLPTEIRMVGQTRFSLEALNNSIHTLEEYLIQKYFLTTRDMSELLSEIPQLWFQKKRGLILEQSRHVLLDWTGSTEIVEQNENVTQESLLAPVAQPKDSGVKSSDRDEARAAPKADEEEDDWEASEWETPDSEVQTDKDKRFADDEAQEDDGTDAWGLEDDLIDSDSVGTKTKSVDHENDKSTVKLSAKYIISTIPKALLHIIQQCVDDSTILQTEYINSPISSQHSSLLSLQVEILELYKALVPRLIARTGYPRMTIYNDCIYLASKSNSDIRTFGERFYTLELQDKLTQIHTIMDRTDGFVSVTISMQKEICHAAIQETLDLLTRTGERYEAQLGRTTLCTALGTLSDAAIVYFVDSVMAMTDISALESTELARLGDALSALEDIFRGVEEGDTVLTAMWCPNWFRFRLLLDILEAKLDYILQLWNDGDLVDFEPGEVVELIRALFSDSPKRRSAIDQITSNI